ncbi:hypothetical protein LNTAR_23654 [Lentisphaera araneosa HTCC2155]|uniref:Uncharacterized protein n=1 Tax=Lentisphaera araneosa HTCC2155 TaxID=313628 RepID=A6DS58_9BACT|nr:hypothetical protein [Lentisphaera araneosa]EDM25518.1 hypothetical protein LNTAR_23654 [Lentisphaera araneosa HTCC2155]
MKKVLPIIAFLAVAFVAYLFLKPKADPHQEIKDQFGLILRKAEETPALKGIPLFSHIRSFKQYLTEDFSLSVPEYKMEMSNREDFINKATSIAPMVPNFQSTLSSYTINVNDDQAEVELVCTIKGHNKNYSFNESRTLKVRLLKPSGTWKIQSVKVIPPTQK